MACRRSGFQASYSYRCDSPASKALRSHPHQRTEARTALRNEHRDPTASTTAGEAAVADPRARILGPIYNDPLTQPAAPNVTFTTSGTQLLPHRLRGPFPTAIRALAEDTAARDQEKNAGPRRTRRRRDHAATAREGQCPRP